jgi:D-alanyl-D-alanine carboxypeptidase (penicillin-binding protein 5/6)
VKTAGKALAMTIRRFCCIASICIAILSLSASLPALGEVSKDPPPISAAAAILIDSNSGEVLYGKNDDARMYPASTTKIMTAILILENGDLSEEVTVSEHAAETQDSPLSLKPGEKLTLEDLLYAILVRSGNSAAVAAAEHIAGSEKAFVEMMNRRAKELGATGTHFVNPNGLHDPDHYTTASDLAKIARHAITFDKFNRIVATGHYVLGRSISVENSYISNHNRLLGSYPGADGIKTGYTNEAGRCLVGSATHDGWRLISVVLNSKDYVADTAALLDYGFSNFKPVCLARRNERIKQLTFRGCRPRTAWAVAGRDLYSVIPRSKRAEIERSPVLTELPVPLRKGQKVGELSASVNGKEFPKVPLICDCDVTRTAFAGFLHFLPYAAISALVLGFAGSRYARSSPKAPRRRRYRI